MTALLHAEPRTPASDVQGSRRRAVDVLLLVGVGLLAFAARLVLVLRGSGLTGIGGYDDGVYYAASVLLDHGHLPYRDFLFLQPPAIAEVLLPFAALARVAGDPFALASARIAFQLVGALNAVLVAVVLRRRGRVAALTGGAFYAVLFPAVYDERTLLTEPLATLGILIALALRPSGRPGSRSAAVIGGIGLGLAMALKIWYVVPAGLVLLAWGGRRWSRRGSLAGGAVGAFLLLTLPLVIAAPGPALKDVLGVQLGRSDTPDTSVLMRLETVFGVIGLRRQPSIPGIPRRVQLVVVLVVVLAALVATLLTPGTRLFAAMLVSDVAILLAAPSFFLHYGALTAAPFALVIGVGAGRLAGARPGAARVVAVLLVVAAFAVALNLRHDHERVDKVTPAAALLAAAPGFPACVMTDDPTVLATMDRLTEQVARGCPLWADVTGWTYDHDRDEVDGVPVQRYDNPSWQRDISRYLTSGNALILVRGATGLSRATHHSLSRGAELFRDGRFVVHAT